MAPSACTQMMAWEDEGEENLGFVTRRCNFSSLFTLTVLAFTTRDNWSCPFFCFFSFSFSSLSLSLMNKDAARAFPVSPLSFPLPTETALFGNIPVAAKAEEVEVVEAKGTGQVLDGPLHAEENDDDAAKKDEEEEEGEDEGAGKDTSDERVDESVAAAVDGTRCAGTVAAAIEEEAAEEEKDDEEESEEVKTGMADGKMQSSQLVRKSRSRNKSQTCA